MQPRNPWPRAVTRFSAVMGLALLVGLAVGHVWAVLFFALLACLVGPMRNLVRLERWLRTGRRIQPPRSEGLWGDIFDNLYRLQRRHRQRRQRLAEVLRRFRNSANAMPDATVVLRDRGEMVWWNPLAERYLGLRWPQDGGSPIANLWRHPDFARFLAQGDWREAAKVPSPVDEGTVLELRIVPYGVGERLLLARDVTRLHRLETMRRDFVANVTHELRTPLTVIQGVAETLADYGAADPSELERPLGLVLQQTRRMGRLIDDLLLLSRLETGGRHRSLERVNVPELLRSVEEEARALSEGRHAVSLEADPGLVLDGDYNELRSAFVNLLSNAVKYTPAGGRIEIAWFEDRRGACCRVSDTGRGIPAHHLPRLTERFYRVDSGRSQGAGGTGLGLAIVKHVLSRHGASLEIESRLDEGSTFTCVFPRFVRLETTAAARRG